MQARTRVNTEQASEAFDAGADPPEIRGRPTAAREEKQRMHRAVSAGVVVLACVEDGKRGNTGSPVGGVARANRTPARGRPGRRGGGWARSTEDAG